MAKAPPLVTVLNGPNLNLLGTRQPALYGHATLDDVEQLCIETAEALELSIDFRQSNLEGELVSWVQECRLRSAGLVINPAGYLGSLALHDAVLALDLPAVEVHITNMHAREDFRQNFLLARACTGTICGLGIAGYGLAIRAIAAQLDDPYRGPR